MHAVTTTHVGDKSCSQAMSFVHVVSYEKTGRRRMPSIHFLQKEGVLSNPHCMLLLQFMQETRVMCP